MSRRRYLTSDISRDGRVNRLAMQAGDFAVMLYTWMIPHADDQGILRGTPEEIMLEVCPGRRDKTPDDVEASLSVMAELGLIEWDRERNIIGFPPDSFYRYQTYIPAGKRRTAPLAEWLARTANISADQRQTPPKSDDRRDPPQTAVSPSPSPSPRDHQQQQGRAHAHAHEAAASAEPPANQPAEPHQTSAPDIHPSVVAWRRWWWERTASAPPQAGRASDIDTYAEGGMSVELITSTIEAAIGRAHDPLSYAAGKLARLWAAGVRTVAEAEAYDRRVAAEEARRKQGSRPRDAPYLSKPRRPRLADEIDEDRYWEDAPP